MFILKTIQFVLIVVYTKIGRVLSILTEVCRNFFIVCIVRKCTYPLLEIKFPIIALSQPRYKQDL